MLNDAIVELENKLFGLNNVSYDSIDTLMRKIMKKYHVTAKELHFGFVKKNKQTPDNWIKTQMKKTPEPKQDNEGAMTRAELETIKREVEQLKKRITKPDQQLPAWIQSKLTRASEYIQTASNYMQSGEDLDENKNLVDTIIDEHCGCEEEPKDMKGHKSLMQLSKKHNVPLSSLKKQLKMGMEVEREHTKNEDMALDIALQHLGEIPDYYTKLKQVEKQKNESVVITDMFGNPKYEFIDLIRPDSISEERKKRYPKGRRKRKKSYPKGRRKGGTLHQWFKGSESEDGKPGWVQADGSPCANEPGETKTPKCFSSGRLERLKSMGKKGKRIIRSAVLRKRSQDPNQQNKTGSAKPTMVSTFAKGRKSKNYVKPEPEIKSLSEATRDRPGKNSGKKDACYHKVKARFSVWPSAYGSAALVRCRKVGADNWGNKSEQFNPVMEATLPTKNGQNMFITVSWRNRVYPMQLFFPQVKVPGRKEIELEAQKIYPGCKILTYRTSAFQPDMPIIQIQNSRSKNYLLNNGTIGEESLVEQIIQEAKSPAWQRSEGKNPEGGLNKKGIASYRKQNPGSKLSLAVTTDPSKLKPGSKKAKRRLAFCRRMSGLKKKLTSAKTAKDPNSRVNKSLRKWNCE
jgi:hypothetical protein